MRQNRFHVFVSLASLGLLTILAGACTHPAANPNPTGANGGSEGSGNGGSSGQGTGGSTGGGGSSSSGSGGAMQVPDGGLPNMPKAACPDDPNQQKALTYTPGYVISASAMTQAMTAVQSMTVQQKANQMRGTGLSQYNDIFRSAHSLTDTAYNDTGHVKEFQFSDGPRGVNLDAVKP